jgi:5-methylcytosine-specific restriction protein A
MSRSVEEWIGKTDDTPIPPRVKLRIWERCGGRCYLTGKKIMPGDAHDYDHIRAICNGGQNRESNIALILRDKHREKTSEDVAEKSKTYRMRAKFLGVWPKSKAKIKSRGFQPTRRNHA